MTPPPAPTGPITSQDAQDGQSARFAAIAQTDTDGDFWFHRVRYRENGTTPWSSLSFSGGYVGEDLGIFAPGTTVNIEVTAYDTSLNPSTALTGNVTSASDVTAPADPTGFSCTAQDSQFTCMWSTSAQSGGAIPNDYASTTLEWDTAADNFASPTTVSGITTDTTIVGSITNGTDYVARIRHADAAGNNSNFVAHGSNITPAASSGYADGTDYTDNRTCNSAEFDCDNPPSYLLGAEDYEDGSQNFYCGELGGTNSAACKTTAEAAGFDNNGNGYQLWSHAGVNDAWKTEIFNDWDDPNGGTSNVSSGESTTQNRYVECNDLGNDDSRVAFRSSCGAVHRPLPPFEPNNNTAGSCSDPQWTGNSEAPFFHVRGTGYGSARLMFDTPTPDVRMRWYFKWDPDPQAGIGKTTRTCYLGENQKWYGFSCIGSDSPCAWVYIKPETASDDSNTRWETYFGNNFDVGIRVNHNGPASRFMNASEWYRMELVITPSSSASAIDGSVTLYADSCGALGDSCPATSTVYLSSTSINTYRNGNPNLQGVVNDDWSNGGGYGLSRTDQLIVVDDSLFQSSGDADAQGNIGEMTHN